MAITLRIYRALKLGDGTGNNRFRAGLQAFIREDPFVRDAEGNALTGPDGKWLIRPVEERETFYNWYLPPLEDAEGVYCTAFAELATHQAIVSDRSFTPLSPRLASPDEVRAWMQGSTGEELSPAARRVLARDRIPVVEGQRGVMWRRIQAHHEFGNRHRKEPGVMDFYRLPLQAQMSAIPARAQDHFRGAMRAEAVDDEWIGQSSTVEEVMLHTYERCSLANMDRLPLPGLA